jgi:PAS domain S-box-containing protein
LYFGAVAVAAWYGGVAAGGVTTILSAALGYALFIAGRDISLGAVAAQLLLFSFEGATISWLTGRLAHERARGLAATAEARAGAEKFETVLSALDHGITLQDREGRLVYANPAAARLLGVDGPADVINADPEQLMGAFEMRDADGSLLAPEKLPSRKLREGHEPEEILVQFTAPGTDDVRWSLIDAKAVRGDGGRLEFVVNVFRDVTERRRQQQELEVSRAWFSIALRSIGDAVVATDAEGKITFVNPVAEALTGWTAVEAEGRPLGEVFRILNEETRASAVSPVDRVIREGAVVGLANHTLLVRRDGTELAIDDSAAPIRDAQGELVGVVLVFRDVTHARRALRRREFLARASVELASSLDYTTTLATVARIAVPMVADWCAVDVVEDGEVRRLAVAHIDPERIRFVEEIQRRYPPDPNSASGVPNILRTGKSEMIAVIPNELLEAAARDEEHLKLIRELRLHSYVGVPLSRGGRTFGAITLVMAESGRIYDEDDLALAEALAERASNAVENARLYRAAQEARTEAELANRAKDDFLAMLGHELRNPLSPIVAALELMKAAGIVGAEREREILERQVRVLVRLVDDLLDVSRITRGRIELARAPVDLADVVAKGLEVATPLVSSRRHELVVDVPRGMIVDGDSLRLAQVVGNLVTNAVKYTEPGGRIVVRGAREGDEVVLRVRDTGIGIPTEILPRVFDVFVQAPQALDRAAGGLGLGLSIVQRLVQLHNGTVSAHSEGRGKGSEFVVRLPAARVSVPQPEDRAAPSPSTERRGLSILVVDDNADVLEMMIAALEMLGHQAHAAGDGRAALELAPRVEPDLALVDLGLPEMDGYELGRRLRALPGLERMRLVAVTGYGQASDRERSAAAGFDMHLVKPVSISTIGRIISDLCADAKR